MVETKKPWQSKTLVLNGVVGLAAFVMLFMPAASAVPTFIQGHADALALIWSVMNIGLRAITKDKISLTD